MKKHTTIALSGLLLLAGVCFLLYFQTNPNLLYKPFLNRSNNLTGTVSLDYDSHLGALPPQFRMAIMIVTEDKKKIPDFFKGIPVESNGDQTKMGKGNAVLSIPKIPPLPFSDEETYQKWVQQHPQWLTQENAELYKFWTLFPEYINRDFSLTFKEFTGQTYFLHDVPRGTAFIWFQSTFDGNRVTQLPFVMKLEPHGDAIMHKDIHIGTWAFYAL